MQFKGVCVTVFVNIWYIFNGLRIGNMQAAIWHCLNHYNYWNATFLAEKLQDESKFGKNSKPLTVQVYCKEIFIL